tara:strand:- start:233 stop:568 length:336 start_codon:yes stop_codon:yes gene_type:complete
MKDITSLCKRVICVHEGSITYDGTLRKLLKKISPVKDLLIICNTEKDARELSNSGFIIKNINQKEITITIEKDALKSTLKEIVNNFDIEDLFINEPPIDEIIGNILVKDKV